MAILPVPQEWLSLFHPFTLTLFFIVTLVIPFWLRRPNSHKPNTPPSPTKLPIIGNLHQLTTPFHRSFRELSNKYGSLMMLQMGNIKLLVVSSAEMANEIIKNHDVAYANRCSTTAGNLLLYGCQDIAFAVYGDYLRDMKKICVNELLSVKRVRSFKFVREEEIALMTKTISNASSQGDPINLTEMLLALTNSIVTRCALGTKSEGHKRFGELSRELMGLIGEFCVGDLFPWLGWVDVLTGLVGRMKKVSRELDIFFDQVIDQRLAQRKQREANYNKDFVDILIDGQENVKDDEFNREKIKAIILDMFLGGTDTTSTTVEWAIAELVKNPNLMKKAQQEVRRVVGNKYKVDEEDFTRMTYLKCVVKETLRLHPPLPFLIPRETSSNTNLKGYDIPAKTRVFINAWAIQRDSKSWEKAEEFVPERFNNTSVDYKGQDFEFIPFGSGRRGCPGMLFSLPFVECVIANLLYWFNWELPGGADTEELDMSDGSGVSVSRKMPLLLRPISQHYFKQRHGK